MSDSSSKIFNLNNDILNSPSTLCAYFRKSSEEREMVALGHVCLLGFCVLGGGGVYRFFCPCTVLQTAL